MSNALPSTVDYRITETPRGVWRRYMYPNGAMFAEFTSRARLLGLPLLHYTTGVSPETGMVAVSRGFIAVGRRAVGVFALGRVAAGIVAVGQASAGVVAVGQATFGFFALGQLAIGIALGIGQVATGNVCIGQLAVGNWVLAQLGLGRHVWSMHAKDPAAIDFFRSLADQLGLTG